MDVLLPKSKSITAVSFGCRAQSNFPASCSLCNAQVRCRWTYAVTEEWSPWLWFIQRVNRGAACGQCAAQLEDIRLGLTKKSKYDWRRFVCLGVVVVLFTAYYFW